MDFAESGERRERVGDTTDLDFGANSSDTEILLFIFCFCDMTESVAATDLTDVPDGSREAGTADGQLVRDDCS